MALRRRHSGAKARLLLQTPPFVYHSIEQCIGLTRGRPMLLNKSFTPPCARCKIRTIVEVRFILQRRLAMTALLGLAPARSTCASAAATGKHQCSLA
jgi:hypothetical protein